MLIKNFDTDPQNRYNPISLHLFLSYMHSHFRSAYLRRSLNRKDRQQLSLSVQDEAVERYAERENINIGEIEFVIESASAWNPNVIRKDYRDLIQKSIARLKAGHLVTLIFPTTSRQSRNNADAEELLNIRKEYSNFEFVFLDGHFPDNAAGRMMYRNQKNQDIFFSENLSEVISRYQKKLIEAGIYPGGAKIGYLPRPKKQLIPRPLDPVKAPILEEVFFRLERYEPTLSVFRWARDVKGLTSSQGTPIGQDTFYTFIRDVFYTGDFKWGTDNQGNPIIHLGKHPIICPKDRFLRVQDILDGKKNVKTRKHRYVFQRFATCGITGDQLSVTTNKGIAYYRSRKLFGSSYYPERDLEVAFLEFLNRLSPKPELLHHLKEQFTKKVMSNQKKQEGQHRATGRQRQAYKMQLENMKTTFRNGEMPYQEYQEHQQEITSKIEALESRAQPNSPASKEQGLTTLEDVVELLQKLSQSYKDFPPHIKAKFARILLSNLIVSPEVVIAEPVPEVQVFFEIGNSGVVHPSSELSKFADQLLQNFPKIEALVSSLNSVFKLANSLNNQRDMPGS